ncbi:protein SPA, chloroplastic [Iris pallida]|uniref:Protein SPA, chloroplastic n=1 Tax=Iris pallida TaxID=29817 RepID=A0AAX6DHH9_IRIPA|nr:protein SPA, chloroplastic [Iris pallida]
MSTAPSLPGLCSSFHRPPLPTRPLFSGPQGSNGVRA